MEQHARRRSVLQRAKWPLALIIASVVLTWVLALALAFVTDPRRGIATSGETYSAPGGRLAIQTWKSSTSSYVEAIRQVGYKRAWGPEQAAGDPDTHRQGDIETAWASATPDGQPEWLILRWDAPVEAASINVYQTYNPGAISAIRVALGDAEPETVWTNAAGPIVANVLVAQLDAPKRIDRVEVYIDSPSVPGWNEIDAVCITDTGGKARCADRVEASSTYADRFGASSLPPIPAWCGVDQPSAGISSGEVVQERRACGAFGWPLPAWVASQTTQVRRSASGIQASLSPLQGPMRAVPTRPLALGVVVNAAVIFAALVALRVILFAPVRTARRLARMQRGACVRCGYDLRYNFAAGCPECGFMKE